ncbi:bifunctional DedA family/phosphatase PAP2 family protein [Cupriavidus lacunae]|uniref:Phosphoesterase n=1 Tax=Cupriavidus lacunae TaxID=2666307 RepID=A0A370NH73_9BURK|nr:bifunctional DedA family/phosphatase PAP2 family protein [Cupriavidus lacunae]RDK04967.1 phosphoesterase [Cupriavidus lacunae]
MEQSYLHFLQVLNGHPVWTEVVVFLAAFLESVAFIGTFIPGSTAMFLAGALIGAGSLDVWVTLLWAVSGAVAGDGMSYWVGRRYKAELVTLWPFSRHREVLEKGKAFFAKQGGKSILLARFLGPVRAIVPVVAGMLGMTPLRFYAINVLSALAWAPAHIIPGIVFGASLQLAGAVTFRLSILLALFVAVVWGVVRLVRLVVSGGARWSDAVGSGLTKWAAQTDNRASRLVLRILVPEHPELGALALAAGVLLAAGWVFFGVLEDVIAKDSLVQLDASVYHFLQGLRTPWGNAVMVAVATVGSVTTLIAVVLAVTGWLCWQRRWRAVGYWLATTCFSQLLIVAIGIAIRQRPPAGAGSSAVAFPSEHVTSSAVVFGFLAFLLARQLRYRASLVVTSTAAILVVLVGFAGLYLGQYWLSDALGGVALGLAWVALVALAYAHHSVPDLRIGAVLPLLVVVLAVSVGAQWRRKPQPEDVQAAPQTQAFTVTKEQWQKSVCRRLPAYRADMEGDQQEAFTIQWAARPDEIERRLSDAGWKLPTPRSAKSLLLLISPNTPVMQLPVLPKLSNGVAPAMEFVHAADHPDARLVVRLWHTEYLIGAEPKASAAPLWIGSVTREHLSKTVPLVNIVRTDLPASPRKESLTHLLTQQGQSAFGSANAGDCPALLLSATVSR